jgi:hypothetical protein
MGIPIIEGIGKRPLTAIQEYSRAKVSGSFVKVPVWGGSSQDRERTAHRYTIKRYGRQSGPVRDAYPTIIFREHKLPNPLFPVVVIWQRFASGAGAHALNRRYPLDRRPG